MTTLDPLNTASYSQRGHCLYALSRYAEAIEACEKALVLAPQRSSPRYWISSSLILLDRPGDARAVLDKVPPGDVFRQTFEAILAARRGDRGRAESLIAKMRAVDGDLDSYQYGQIYAQLGDTDRAFAALNKAVEVRDAGLFYFKRDPFLDPIRRETRYAALLKRLKFPS